MKHVGARILYKTNNEHSCKLTAAFPRIFLTVAWIINNELGI